MPKKRLDRKAVLDRLIKANGDIPPKVTKTALDVILQDVFEALVQGRQVTLRGFGRLIPRHYPDGPKLFGVLFHPSPKLTDRVNRRVPKAGRSRQ
jgi:hypothetical protein